VENEEGKANDGVKTTLQERRVSMNTKYTGCGNANEVGNKVTIQDMEYIDKTGTTQEKK